MLVRALYLSAIWFALSLFGTLIMGSRLRRSDSTVSLLWLTGVILAGNLIAIFTFGRLLEIFGFSLLAFGLGLYLIFFFLEAITLLLALAHMHESLDVVCRIQWRHLLDKLEPIPGYLPMVSLQVPAYNEPVTRDRSEEHTSELQSRE